MMRKTLLILALLLPALASAQTVTLTGRKSNNASAPSTNSNLPVMPTIACSSTQSLTAGRVVFPCTDLFGSNWVVLKTSAGADVTLASDATAGGTKGTTGPQVMTVRDDALSTLSEADNTPTQFRGDSMGRVWTIPGGPCQDHARLSSVAINISTATTTELVALASGQTVYVCGYEIVTTAADSVTWKYGTGSACGTGTASISGAEAYAANGGVKNPNTGFVQFKTASANALCLTTSAAVQASGYVTYVQTATP